MECWLRKQGSHCQEQERQVLAAQHGQPGAAHVLGGLVCRNYAIELTVDMLGSAGLLQYPAALLHVAALHQAVGGIWQEEPACNWVP